METTLEKMSLETDIHDLMVRQEYKSFALSTVQATELRKCEGIGSGGLPVDLDAARIWAVERNTTLLADGCDRASYYCAFQSTPEWVAYRSTSGTVHVVTGEENNVWLPVTRLLGHHHAIITLILGGLSSENIDYWFLSSWRLFDRRSREERMEAVESVAAMLDPILVPAGFPPRKTVFQYLEEYDARESQREACREDEGSDFEGEISYDD